ncbi:MULTISPECIES: cold-shock protein [unclassified Paenibacillus]|uniref:cold-shock protein n=1 Tax=unclassified Paenibacillus TaxID=185978 RepID=UPI001AE73CDD|nr:MULTISPECIES: cold-shock protein [unclassified Paenibacillus]
MHYSRNNQEPVKYVKTSVWICKKENCIGWIREGFSFEITPFCPLCKSEMIQATKMLPILNINFKGNY